MDFLACRNEIERVTTRAREEDHANLTVAHLVEHVRWFIQHVRSSRPLSTHEEYVLDTWENDMVRDEKKHLCHGPSI